MFLDIKEYCNRETFHAECSPNEVIVMRHALYGRMSLGRCVKVDLGKDKIQVYAVKRSSYTWANQ